jgi:hypothetical protein
LRVSRHLNLNYFRHWPTTVSETGNICRQPATHRWSHGDLAVVLTAPPRSGVAAAPVRSPTQALRDCESTRAPAFRLSRPRSSRRETAVSTHATLQRRHAVGQRCHHRCYQPDAASSSVPGSPQSTVCLTCQLEVGRFIPKAPFSPDHGTTAANSTSPPATATPRTRKSDDRSEVAAAPVRSPKQALRDCESTRAPAFRLSRPRSSRRETAVSTHATFQRRHAVGQRCYHRCYQPAAASSGAPGSPQSTVCLTCQLEVGAPLSVKRRSAPDHGTMAANPTSPPATATTRTPKSGDRSGVAAAPMKQVTPHSPKNRPSSVFPLIQFSSEVCLIKPRL